MLEYEFAEKLGDFLHRDLESQNQYCDRRSPRYVVDIIKVQEDE